MASLDPDRPRGAGLLEVSVYKGPRRWALIHGLLFGVPSLDQLRDGFAPWWCPGASDAALRLVSPLQLRSDATGGETRGWK